MNCDEIRPLLAAYADGELDAAAILEVERHAQTCEACKRALQNQSVLKKAVAASAPYFKAPPDLRRDLLAAIREKSAAETEASPAPSRARASGWQWTTPKVVLAMAACLALGFFGELRFAQHSQRGQLMNELASSHVRSLLAEHLMDVVSTDQHTVKPWFDGRIDFAPPVNDLATHGYPLLGGRLDYIGGREVAVLVYGKQKHFINLFIWPAPGDSEETEFTGSKNGYNLVGWSHAGMAFWAVSDVNKTDLLDFSHQFDAAAAAPPAASSAK
ncbi:MAG TPA: anti-sigma factor [Chthoniobacteraceae bacterium]|nr:anti-sigma factor [Chthoniobacteraceae bacterium]